jgi:hypothetical protein
MMRTELVTYYLRKFVNHIVDSTLYSPSLAEMVHHHLGVEWTRQRVPPYQGVYHVFDDGETYLELHVTDARGYLDHVYLRGLALLRIGVNGALVTPEDETFARSAFAGRPFRTCPHCHQQFDSWLDYYGHAKMAHWTAAS